MEQPNAGDRPAIADPAEADQPVEGGRDEVAELPGADTRDAMDAPADEEGARDRR